MEFFAKLIDFVMHVDVHLNSLIVTYQLWTYLILFAVIFCETGLVVTPFLPGDSLLFATGALGRRPRQPAARPLAVPGPRRRGRARRYGELLDRPRRRARRSSTRKRSAF